MNRKYRLAGPGEVGQLKPKLWFNILSIFHFLFVMYRLFVTILTDKIGLLILQFPIALLLFFLAISVGSNTVIYEDDYNY